MVSVHNRVHPHPPHGYGMRRADRAGTGTRRPLMLLRLLPAAYSSQLAACGRTHGGEKASLHRDKLLCVTAGISDNNALWDVIIVQTANMTSQHRRDKSTSQIIQN